MTLLAAGLTDAAAQSPMRFRDTPGAKAFVAKDYPRALEEFRRLRQANPNNTLILRYLAITLSQLGRYQEAIGIFKEALAIAPNKAWIHYHLGVTYYNARLGKQAAASFRRVMALAQGTQYAQLASRYLDAIAQQQSQQQRIGTPQRFGAFVQGGYQYDNNIPAAANGVAGPRGGNRFTGYVNLDYYLHRSPVWLVTASINGYQNWYDGNNFNALETPQYSGGLRAQRTGTLGRYPYIGSVNYNYRRVYLSDGSPYSRSHALTLGLRMNLSKTTATYGYYRYTNDDFAAEGFDPVFSSRDANNHALGLRHTWYFAQRQGQVSVGLDYQKNDARGLNFEMDSLSGKINAIFPLPWALRAEFDVGYGTDDYSQFVGPVRRKTDRKTVSAGLSRWFGQRVQMRLDYSYRDEASSYDQLSYDRTVWGASLNYVY
ncbi:MAG TPA: tetratricopeptide repeat protein [Acidiferrobacteraceae bacterium]|nr:tetratricopeptide repeat protein [Acidiferrobacteraceae bacterium]